MSSSTLPITSVTHSRRSRRMRSTPACRVLELMAQLLHAPCSCSSTTPVSTSALTSTRSPPSCWMIGRTMSSSSVSWARRPAFSSSLSNGWETTSLGPAPPHPARPPSYRLALGSRPRPPPAQVGLHERVEVPVQDGRHVARLVARPQVLDQLEGRQDVAPDL